MEGDRIGPVMVLPELAVLDELKLLPWVGPVGKPWAVGESGERACGSGLGRDAASMPEDKDDGTRLPLRPAPAPEEEATWLIGSSRGVV